MDISSPINNPSFLTIQDYFKPGSDNLECSCHFSKSTDANSLSCKSTSQGSGVAVENLESICHIRYCVIVGVCCPRNVGDVQMCALLTTEMFDQGFGPRCGFQAKCPMVWGR